MLEDSNESTHEDAGNWAGTGKHFKLQILENSKANCTSNAAGMLWSPEAPWALMSYDPWLHGGIEDSAASQL